MTEHELLLKTFTYEPSTGLFVRLVNRPNAPIGTKTKGSKDKWGYLLIGFNGKRYKAHRLAWFYMTGEWPSIDIDHENLDKTDNRWVNLRLASETQNQANTLIRTTNTSGYKGVSKKHNKWRARIQINRKVIHLGAFDTIEEAASSYHKAAIRYFGEYARV